MSELRREARGLRTGRRPFGRQVRVGGFPALPAARATRACGNLSPQRPPGNLRLPVPDDEVQGPHRLSVTFGALLAPSSLPQITSA